MIINVQVYFITCVFINVYGELTKLPSTFHEEDYHKTTLKDTNKINANPDGFTSENSMKKRFASKRQFKPEPVCQKDINPFELRRLYKTYENDGGKVQFVSADSLTVSEDEAKNLECLSGNLLATKVGDRNLKSKDANIKIENRTATAPSAMKGIAKTSLNVGDKVVDPSRRGNEYQFDSIEYYDEEITFHESQCPGLVEVIDLEMSEIRKYDVECELISQWESLI